MTGLSGDALRAIRPGHTNTGDPKRDAPLNRINGAVVDFPPVKQAVATSGPDAVRRHGVNPARIARP
ncbi:hypothetical protein [Burkholderia sp. BCC0044]|uniref:hypothetical protein n=1 Tax=Burkholderia sp. BCC0044 TaxID=2676295 RepID=UPI0015883505|nr:hypothetical protein [Burkholderia sp. BCC0044]